MKDMCCPACGVSGFVSVERSMGLGDRVLRQRACRCGAQWSTMEQIVGAPVIRAGVVRRRVTPEQKAEVTARDGDNCAYCESGGKLGVDHVVPLSAKIPPGVDANDESDWRNSTDNMVLCCVRCNLRKGDGSKYRPLRAATGSNRPQPGVPWRDRVTPIAVSTPSDGRGVGGVLSDGSESPPESDPIPTVVVSPKRARVKAAVVYDAAFDAEWLQTAKTGSKDNAQKAWVVLGKPAFGGAWKRWEASAAWQVDWYNYPHVVTWLRDGRWKQDPSEATPKAPTPIRPAFSAEPFAVRAERERQERVLEARAERVFGK